VFANAGRLRLKESDRIASVCAAVNALGGKAFAEGDSLIIEGGERPKGGTVDACGDHRIAMLAAAAAPWCTGPVKIIGAEAVDKSYPGFWLDFASLGGYVSLEEV
jgi:3-phosphoshikimate 1-carboxyvinyltransferase